MNQMFILTILIIGLSGLIAQVLLLRELLTSFYGNELVLGIILANWLIAEALGVILFGRYIDRAKNKISIFIILEIIFSLALPVSIYFSRVFKTALGIPYGEALGILTILYISFLIILPVAMSHGALFSCWSKIYGSIGKVYALETTGTIIGGIIFTYFIIPYLNSLQVVFIVGLLNLFICLSFFKYAARTIRYITLTFLMLALYLSLSGKVENIHRFSLEKQWPGQSILDYRNSVYGNIVVTNKEKQYTFFYNGIPIVTTPYPDIIFVQEFGNLPLLFHPYPKDALIIGAGGAGLINEMLRHPLKKIDYAELDPLIIQMLKKYPSELTRKEMGAERLKIIYQDGRLFVRNTPNKYDVILIGLSRPSDLATNRLFTQEFFALAKRKLNKNGILSFCLPGSLTYISQELKELNACILNSLNAVFGYVRIIPGDYNMFLASDAGEILEASPSLITRRMHERNIQTQLFIPAYLKYRLDKERIEWFKHSSLGATTRANKDFNPFALFKMLVFWNKQFSPVIFRFFSALEKINLKIISLLLGIITLILFYLFSRNPGLIKFNIVYSIATTGFFSMLINLILIFSFQVFYGYLYYTLGLLISIFMSGIALGSIVMTQNLRRIKERLRLFIILEIIIIIFTYILALGISKLSGWYIVLFFISGFLTGWEFPLASKIYLTNKENIGLAAGSLYSADLLGGWFAGILGGIVFLPILGLFNTCMVIVLVKLSSVGLLLSFRKKFKGI